MKRTKKAARSRFHLTKSGRLKRSRGGKSHLMTGKNRKRKRSLRKGAMVHASDDKRIRSLLPHG